MTKGLYIKTYGCQMNVYDSDRMADVLAPFGYALTEAPENADLIVLNTCHIREKAAEKLYSDIGRLRVLKARGDKGAAPLIAVAGCVAQAEGREIMRRAPDVDIVFGPQTYHRLPALVEEAINQNRRNGRSRVVDTDFPEEVKFDHLPGERFSEDPTAFLTIQEGCDKFCTFCVVPYTRGAEFSRPVQDIVDEAKRRVDAGVVEITLLGQNVNAYHGLDKLGRSLSLAGLIRELAGIDGLRRIRYTTSHPRDMTDELMSVHADIPACMPYLHLPVQSGSDKILEAMNRAHKVEKYFDIIEQLRAKRPDIAISGDFIVGFPGETDADFAQTMALVERVNYAQAYSFKYSPRPGTPAAESSDQVPESVKAERLAALQSLLNRQQLEFNQAMIGRTLPILFERAGQKPGQVLGKSPFMQSVYVETAEPKRLLGQIIDVNIAAAGPNSLTGSVTGRVAA